MRWESVLLYAGNLRNCKFQLRIDIALLPQMIEKKETQKISWIDTCSQIANLATKVGASGQLLLVSLETKKLKIIEKDYKYYNELRFMPLFFLSFIVMISYVAY